MCNEIQTITLPPRNGCIGGGWNIIGLDQDCKKWTGNGEGLAKEELKGAIGITVDNRPTKSHFRKMTSLATRFIHFLRNLERDFPSGHAPLSNSLNPSHTTHAFVIVKTKKDQENIVEVADADDAGVLRHDYNLNSLLSDENAFYSNIAIVVPPRKLRKRIAKMSKMCSSSLEIGNLLTEIRHLEKKLKRIGKEKMILEKKRFSSPQEMETWFKLIREEVKIRGKLEDKRAANEKVVGNTPVAPYNKEELNFIPFSGKLPLFNRLPFSIKLWFFAKKRERKRISKDYLQVLDGHMILDKRGKPKPLFCSEFAIKMMKMAMVDVELKKKLGKGELKALKESVQSLNKIINDEKADASAKEQAKEFKSRLMQKYAQQVNVVVKELQKKEILFHMKDNGVVPGELLVVGERKLYNIDNRKFP